jgi:hypothetical protein
LNCKTERGCNHADRDNGCGNRLRFAVTVGMSRVGWPCRNRQSSPDHDRTAHVQGRFNSICNQHIRMPKNARENFYRSQNNIDGKAKQGDARTGPPDGRIRPVASLQIVCGGVRMLRRRH